MPDNVIEQTDGAVGWIVFNNPKKRNAISLAMFEALGRIVDRFAQRPDICMVALRGAGTEAFISGADISEFGALRTEPEAVRRYDDIAEQTLAKLRSLSKPTVAVIDGFCIGGGVAVALNCDLRICSDDAAFAIPAARLGVGYKQDDVRTLTGIVGPANAKEILITARRYSAAEALGMGLVNRVISKTMLQQFASEYCHAIAQNAPLTMAAAKAAIEAASVNPQPLDPAIQASIMACFASEDYQEGQRAFLEKRSPKFRGV